MLITLRPIITNLLSGILSSVLHAEEIFDFLQWYMMHCDNGRIATSLRDTKMYCMAALSSLKQTEIRRLENQG